MSETHPATDGRHGTAPLGRGGLPRHPRAPGPSYPACPPPAEHATPRHPHHPRGVGNGGGELPGGARDRPSGLHHHPRGEGNDGREAGGGFGGVSAGGSGGVSDGVLETPGSEPEKPPHVAVRTPASGDPDSCRESKTASPCLRAGVPAVDVVGSPSPSPAAAAPSSHNQGRADVPLFVHWPLRLVGGEAGRAVAAAQGRALAALLATLAEVEVGQDEEVQP